MGFFSSVYVWLHGHKNAIMNVLAVAAPIAVGVVQHKVISPETLITAGGTLMAKLAASPVDHSGTVEDAHAVAVQERKAGVLP